jgi:hypothetical protein
MTTPDTTSAISSDVSPVRPEDRQAQEREAVEAWLEKRIPLVIDKPHYSDIGRPSHPTIHYTLI